MSLSPDHFTAALLPRPKQLTARPGHFHPRHQIHINSKHSLDPRVQNARQRWCKSANLQPTAQSADTKMRITISEKNHTPDESYRLEIKPNQLLISAPTPQGQHHALQTLTQLATTFPFPWPCMTIEDALDLPLRGLSFDVTRGRVPKMSTLKSLVDRLASWKINHLQLYIEHAFDFRFDPDIARDCDGLTHEDITELKQYCRERFITLTPSLACFGHMGRILSLPQYRHLAEIPADKDWESQNWVTRLKGLTLNARHPDARKLVQRMLDEFLPLFDAPFVNIGGDETHDLGQGANREFCEAKGRGRLYVDHLKFLANCCREHGKRMMFWGDVIRSFPEMLREIPEDAVMLDWGYEPDSTFPAVSHPARAGRDVVVCPGTRGWNRLINDLPGAEQNLENATRAAAQHRASGIIITDWGDHGHFNLPACSLPAIAQAAAKAWNNQPNPSPCEPRTSVRADAKNHNEPQKNAATPYLTLAIERHVFGGAPAGTFDALRNAAASAGHQLQTWPALYTTDPSNEHAADFTRRSPESVLATAENALSYVERMPDAWSRDAWSIGCHAMTLLAAKHTSPADFRRRADDFWIRYTAAWLTRYRPKRLHDLEKAMRNTCQ